MQALCSVWQSLYCSCTVLNLAELRSCTSLPLSRHLEKANAYYLYTGVRKSKRREGAGVGPGANSNQRAIGGVLLLNTSYKPRYYTVVLFWGWGYHISTPLVMTIFFLLLVIWTLFRSISLRYDGRVYHYRIQQGQEDVQVRSLNCGIFKKCDRFSC